MSDVKSRSLQVQTIECESHGEPQGPGDPRFEVLMGALVGRTVEERKRRSAEASLCDAETELAEKREALNQTRGALNQTTAQLQTAEARAAQLQAEVTTLKAHAEKLQLETTLKFQSYDHALAQERALRQQLHVHASERAKNQAAEADRLRAKLAQSEYEFSKKAAESFQLKNALESSEVRLAGLIEEMSKLRSCFETASKELEESWANRFAERVQELGETEERLYRLETQFQEATEADAKTRARLESALTQAQDRVVDLGCELSLLQEAQEKLDLQCASERKRAEVAEEFLRRSEAECARLMGELSSAQGAASEREDLCRRLREVEARFAETLNAQGELRVDLLQARREAEGLRQEKAELSASIQIIEKELEAKRSADSDVIALPEEVATALAAFEESQKQIADARGTQAAIQAELDSVREALAAAQGVAKKSQNWVLELKAVAHGLQKEFKPGSSSARKFSLLADLCAGDDGFFGED